PDEREGRDDGGEGLHGGHVARLLHPLQLPGGRDYVPHAEPSSAARPAQAELARRPAIVTLAGPRREQQEDLRSVVAPYRVALVRLEVCERAGGSLDLLASGADPRPSLDDQ